MNNNHSHNDHCCSVCAEMDKKEIHNHKRHGGDDGSKTKSVIRIAFGLVFLILALILQRAEKSIFSYFSCYLISYIIFGYDVIIKAVKNLFSGHILDENFLMSIASIGAFFIGEYPEAAAVMIFYKAGEYFEKKAVQKSKKSITDLMDIRPDYANLISGNDSVKVEPEKVNINDFILVKPGEKVPLDGVVADGFSVLDTSALTGESQPRDISVGDTVYSGCINKTGVITIKVTKKFSESTVSKIIDLVENASSKKAHAETFITKFSKYYTPVVVILAVLIAVIPPLFTDFNFSDWIMRGLIFLVISCPCALVISIPLTFFSGIGFASANGILIKGSNYLEALNELETVVFDKTGTLTEGMFSVAGIYPENGYEKEQLLEICAKAEAYSNHPIALSILKAYGREIDKGSISKYTEIAGKGISVEIEGKNVFAGNEKLMENISYTEPEEAGTKIYVIVDGSYCGCIVISDRIKKDSFNLVEQLKLRSVNNIIMLTGDNNKIAKIVAQKLKITEYYSELLPDKKVEKTEEFLAKSSGKLAFAGDGINDAPVLARADIGIAMGGLGADASIEAADIVIMTDEPSKIVIAIDIARATGKIVRQNIVFILLIKGAFLLMGAFGVATMWEAVFADVGVSVIAILNAMRVPKTLRVF